MIGSRRYNILVLNSLFYFGTLAILQTDNDPVQLLWNLTNFAIQSRQSPANIFQNNYQSYHPSNNYRPNTQILLEALHTIAEKDDHHCVPKLLCEVAAGKDVFASRGRQLSLSPSLQVDMDSLFGLLSSFETPSTSPVLLFGKAVLIGYKSKDGTDACTSTYPRCPSRADVLLNYLNNYNGGFFRYFDGIKSGYLNHNNLVSGTTLPNQIVQHYPSFQQDFGYRYSKKRYGEHPINKFEYTSDLKFPYNYNENNIEDNHGKIIFPERDFDEHKNQDFNGIHAIENYRYGKKLTFPIDYEDYRDEKRRPVVYADRTGTGELLLETSNL